jgi:ketosteroid isomerase-like protein
VDPAIQAIEEGFARFNEGDFEQALISFHEDCEWVEAPELPGGKTWRGREEILTCLTQWRETWGEITMQPVDFVDCGKGTYLVTLKMRASGSASGTPVDMDLWAVSTVAGGTFRRISYHVSELSARQAAGLDDRSV